MIRNSALLFMAVLITAAAAVFNWGGRPQRAAPAATSGLTATSGKLYDMTGAATYDLTKQAAGWRKAAGRASAGADRCSVPFIGVVTTLKSQLDSVEGLLEQYKTAQVVVVGDSKSQPFEAPDAIMPRVHFLSVDDQNRLYPELSHAMPLRSFSRKNVGYVHAVALGACYIWDFDDDNLAVGVAVLDRVAAGRRLNASLLLGAISAPSEPAVNPYVLFGPARFAWPRGYPLEYSRDRPMPALASAASRGLAGWEVDVVQMLQQVDADVDAVWRLQNPLPLAWAPPGALADGKALAAIDPTSFAPYNAQSTLVSRRAAFSLYLPHTVHGRVSDIWRSYFAQGVLPAMRGLLAFAAPFVDHLRNPHNYLADFDAEIPLYTRSAQLLQFIQAWRSEASSSSSGDAAAAMLELYIEVAEHGIFDGRYAEELQGLAAFTAALHRLEGYAVPAASSVAPNLPVQPPVDAHSKVLAVVHLGPGQARDVPLWRALHPELRHAVFYLAGASPCPALPGEEVVCLGAASETTLAYQSALHAHKSKPEYQHYLVTRGDAVMRPAALRRMLASGVTHHGPLHFQPGTATAAAFWQQWPGGAAVNASAADMKACGLGERLHLSLPRCAGGGKPVWAAGASGWFLATAADMASMQAAGEYMAAFGMPADAAAATLFQCYAAAPQPYRLQVSTEAGKQPAKLRTAFCRSDADVAYPLSLTTRQSATEFLRARECSGVRA